MSRRRRTFFEVELRRLKRAGLSPTAIADCLDVTPDLIRVFFLRRRRGKRAPTTTAIS